jgi:hypothetical protein
VRIELTLTSRKPQEIIFSKFFRFSFIFQNFPNFKFQIFTFQIFRFYSINSKAHKFSELIRTPRDFLQTRVKPLPDERSSSQTFAGQFPPAALRVPVLLQVALSVLHSPALQFSHKRRLHVGILLDHADLL